jgi:hypothetical protein
MFIIGQDKEAISGSHQKFFITIAAQRFSIDNEDFMLHILMGVHRYQTSWFNLE